MSHDTEIRKRWRREGPCDVGGEGDVTWCVRERNSAKCSMKEIVEGKPVVSLEFARCRQSCLFSCYVRTELREQDYPDTDRRKEILEAP